MPGSIARQGNPSWISMALNRPLTQIHVKDRQLCALHYDAPAALASGSAETRAKPQALVPKNCWLVGWMWPFIRPHADTTQYLSSEVPSLIISARIFVLLSISPSLFFPSSSLLPTGWGPSVSLLLYTTRAFKPFFRPIACEADAAHYLLL